VTASAEDMRPMAEGYAAARDRRSRWITWALLLPLLVFVLFPFYWMALTALKQDADLYSTSGNPFWFNLAPTLDHVRFLISETQFLRWFSNSLLTGLAVSAITILVAVPGGYALSRYDFPLAQALGIGMFLSYLVPQALLFIPLSRMLTSLGLRDSALALILVYPTLTVPFCTWFMMGYLRAIPRQLDEAARMDGCSTLALLWRVIVPLSWPGIVTIGLYAFVMTWQEYLYAITFISASDAKPLPVAATTDLVRGDVYFWGPLMAAALLGSLPTVLVFAFLSRTFVAGMTKGAIK
jgi:multiple sugar transport system permease protein